MKWDDQRQSIETTFLPEYDIKETKNSFDENDFDHQEDFMKLNKSLDIYHLSHFSDLGKKEIIKRLQEFIHLYEVWIKQQKEKPSVDGKVEYHIIKDLQYNLDRLKNNIELLEDDKIYRAFQLANTAMLIQIIISNDKNFAKEEKHLNELGNLTIYKDLNVFKTYDFNHLPSKRPKYRPFQLAFLILNLDGITELLSESRRKVVDLIWFPTGGGKTEAYLAVAAYTIIYRRLTNPSNFEGTSVIMRYTLRLLTAQQFERASRLIVALEFVRSFLPDELKTVPITIGMWVGMSSTPNTISEASDRLDELNKACNKKDGNPESKNVFQISACPWCGTKLVTKNKNGKWDYGFEIKGKGKQKSFKLKCLNEHCHFHQELPIQVVDEMLYHYPPTLLFGTVDKFAMLSWRENGHRFFNSLDDKGLPPDLIIQDELHLLTGPLGSITGFFESVIELLCKKGNRVPKIISSTATTRNTSEQIKALYGVNRKVNIFPPSGLSYEDSFFAKVAKSKSKRRYIGFLPTGKSSIDTQLRLLAHLLVARLETYKSLKTNDIEIDYDEFDKYWTVVSYYNSLKDVGKIHNKVGDEISTFTSSLQHRLHGNNPYDRFNYAYLHSRDEELTSRVESTKIKQTLKRLEENKFTATTIAKSANGNTYVKGGIIDLVLATNMISVGIDIDRFNLMLVNGQPRNVAEYIQTSSRVGRKHKGLVVTLLDANRARDKSHFEHFIAFHQAFYKSVEPVSLTPFTENTLEKMLTSIVVTYVRHKIPGMAAKDAAQHFQPYMLDKLRQEIKERFSGNTQVYNLFEQKLEHLSNSWLEKIKEYDLKYYETTKSGEVGLLSKPQVSNAIEDTTWSTMQSMREIDTNSFIKKELPKSKKNV
ncbi:MAG: helicase-related protein [Bacteroidota bacterium]